MNPQPIPWPERRTRGAPPSTRAPVDEPTGGDELENICANYPELCVSPGRPIPGVFIPSPVDDPTAFPSTRPGTTPLPRGTPAGYPYGVPAGYPSPFELPFPSPNPMPGPARAPARRAVPQEPAFPWPSELLPRSGRRTQPRTPRPTRRPLPREQPLTLQPGQPIGADMPIGSIYDPLPSQPSPQPNPSPSVPNAPNDPCRAAATEQKREQRRRRKECKKFTTKTIRVCADKR